MDKSAPRSRFWSSLIMAGILPAGQNTNNAGSLPLQASEARALFLGPNNGARVTRTHIGPAWPWRRSASEVILAAIVSLSRQAAGIVFAP